MIPYTIHVAILLAGMLAFYLVFLRRETFFRLNRWMLIGSLLLAFTLPLARVPAKWSLRQAPVVATADVPTLPDAQEPVYPSVQAPNMPSRAATVAATSAPAFFNKDRVLQWAGWLYWFGVIAFAINLLTQAGFLLARALSRPSIRDGRFRIVELEGKVAPCSFGNWIFINPEQYDWDTYQQVLEHEKVHCRDRHTLDIVLAELMLVFQWFNPFAWSFRKTLEQNLEFLTDEAVLRGERVDPSSYQMSLLRVSAPHLPLGLTTNYNQSLLKKRILMMQAKRSSWHNAWKYFFLLPLLALMISLLNDPAAMAQNRKRESGSKTSVHGGLATQGNWFATIKGDRVSMQFRNDDEGDRSMNGNSFALSDFSNLPRNGSGTFTLKRDAGTLELTGRFDGDQGMGRYKFVADESYARFLREQGMEPGDERDRLVLFFVDASRSFITGLKGAGFSKIDRDELVPLAALKVDAAYINSLREAGVSTTDLSEYIPLRSLGVTKAYVQDIRTVYPNITADRLVTLKAQGIDSRYIKAARDSRKSGKDEVDAPASPDEAATPARPSETTRERVRDREAVRGGGDGLDEIVSMKALGVDDAYIRSIREAGFPDISVRKLNGFKALGVTADFIKGLRAAGFSELSESDVSGARALGVDAAFVRSFDAVGFKGLRLRQYISMKAMGITPQLVKEYQDLGFTDLRPNDVTGAKAVGATPEYLRSMKAKGYVYPTLKKATSAKAQVD